MMKVGLGLSVLLTAFTLASSAPLGFAEPNQGATIRGTVVFSGRAPAPKPVEFGAEKQCALLHGNNPPYAEDLVVNANGALKWTLVYVANEVPGDVAPPTEPLIFDQKGCLFSPHVGAVMVGQPIEVRNSDPVLHNVRAQSKAGQSFNIAQPVQGMKTTKTFKKPEIGIPLKCDVHFWMTAYLHVLSNPFFAITGADGTFTIEGLSPGTYTLAAWHEKLGEQTHTVIVQEGQRATVTFTFAAQ